MHACAIIISVIFSLVFDGSDGNPEAKTNAGNKNAEMSCVLCESTIGNCAKWRDGVADDQAI